MPIVSKQPRTLSERYSNFFHLNSTYPRGFRRARSGKRADAQDAPRLYLEKLGEQMGMERAPSRSYSVRGLRKLASRDRVNRTINRQRLVDAEIRSARREGREPDIEKYFQDPL